MMWDAWGSGYGMDWGWFGAAHLFWWVLLIAGAAVLLRYVLADSSDTRRADDPARTVLRERHARGEPSVSTLNRRKLLQFTGVAAVAGIAGAAWMQYGPGRFARPLRPYPSSPVEPANFKQKLFVPGTSGAFGVLDVKGPLDIRTIAATFPLVDGRPSPFLLYQTQQQGQAYQNPILRIESGARFAASLENGLAEPTIIHWHGLHTPARMDGHPADTIAAGGRYAYDFAVRNRGGTYWYHTHAHELTAEQAYHGLASFFLVDDDDQRRLSRALSLQFGVTDLPVVIQDKQFDAQGQLLYRPSAHEAMMGWLGDVVLANLTPNAVQSVAPRVHRLRLLNGSNARIYRLAFVEGGRALDFAVIGTDGGLIDRPQTVKEAFLAPGERLDILFDAGQVRPGTDIFLKSLAFDPMENEGPGGGMGGTTGMGMAQMMAGMSSSRLPLGAEFNILKLAVVEGERVTAPVPARLSEVRPIRTEGAAQRRIDLTMGQMRFLINGRSFRKDDIAFDVRRGAVEIWNIDNPSLGMPHPMHLHGFGFQVIERLNSPPALASLGRFGGGRTVSDLGWKDTVLVWPGETVRIAIDFSHDFPGDQTYVFHCHNLEHEDAGMMINFRVRG